MSPHDQLTQSATELRDMIEDYVEEFGPDRGYSAIQQATALLITLERFIDSEAYSNEDY